MIGGGVDAEMIRRAGCRRYGVAYETENPGFHAEAPRTANPVS